MSTDSLTIITNGLVVTCDSGNRAGAYTIVLRNGRIAEITERSDSLLALHSHATIVDASGKLIIPGFINAHFHTESLLLRERTRHLHMALWKQDIRLHEASQRLVASDSMDDIRTLYLAAYFAHLKSGTTCVGECTPAVSEKGLVKLLQTIERTDVKSVVTLQNWDQLRQAKELGPARPRVMLGLGKEQDYTVYTFENTLREALEMDIPVVAHLAEQREDVEVVRKNFLKDTLAVLRDFRILRENTVLVHLNHISPQEADIVADIDAPVVISPMSSALKQTGFPSLRHLASRNVFMALGTDWGSCDMLEEMRFLYRLPLIVSGLRRFTAVELLRMGTINGAHALGIASETGSIEVGKKADLAFFSLADLRMPEVSPTSSVEEISDILLTSFSSKDISDVMIDGEFYLRDHRIMTLEEQDVKAGMREMNERYFPQPKTRPIHAEAERQQAKMILFWPEPRKGAEVKEGFEHGFAPPDKKAGQGVSPASAREESRQKQSPGGTRPPATEPPKEIKKVFGEDDLF